MVIFNTPPNIVSPLPTGLKSSYFVTYNKVKEITYKGLFADVDGDTLTSSVGIVVGSYAKALPHWIFWDSTNDKLDIFPTDTNVGHYKIRITGKDPWYGEVNYDIDLEVYQLPGLPQQSVEFNEAFSVAFDNRFTSSLSTSEKYKI